MYKAKKSLGQNFLKSKSALRAIVQIGNVQKNDTILEIGPGRGALTQVLLETGAQVIAIEKDRELIPYLKELFLSYIKTKQLILVEGDILTISLDALIKKKSYKLIANIPYYITGEIMRLFFEKKHQPCDIVFLVQKEVAERIVSKDKKESILSLSVKAYSRPEYIQTVPRGAFSPSPRVDSAIIHMGAISRKHFKTPALEKVFFQTIKAGFASKRKKVIKNLEILYTKENLENAFSKYNIDHGIRAEKIPIERWFQIVEYLYTISRKK